MPALTRPATRHVARTRRRRRLAVALLAVAAVVVPALPAQATPPGDNGRIAFRRFLNQERTWGAVFTIRPDGRGERQVTHPPQGFVDRNPDVSPDGRRIVFQREGVACDPACISQDIYVVNVDGTGLKKLTRNRPGTDCDTGAFCDHSPAWSPDGRWIAFARETGPFVDDLVQNFGLFVMTAHGGHLRRLTQKASPALGEDGEPQWSPDGERIVFERFNVRGALPDGSVALWVLDLPTGTERRITPFNLEAGDTPDWSPDGSKILFHDNHLNVPGLPANLWTVRPDGTHLTQLTSLTGNRQYLGSSWSPDGRKIVAGRRPETAGNADIFVLHADGTHPRNITNSTLYDSYPDWGPLTRH
jgi:TolB protein